MLYQSCWLAKEVGWSNILSPKLAVMMLIEVPKTSINYCLKPPFFINLKTEVDKRQNLFAICSGWFSQRNQVMSIFITVATQKRRFKINISTKHGCYGDAQLIFSL